MGKVNTKVKYDPDFGSRMIPDIDSIYQVQVTPRSKKKNRWMFFLFMPKITDEDDIKTMITIACETLLDKGEGYKVITFDIENYDDEKLKYIPLASFDPDDPRSFMWVTPHRSKWN